LDVVVKQAEVLAVIQARGNSKGLLNKNLLRLQGHPLVAYSVTSALSAIGVTRTIVSTDSEAIAEVACAYGAEAPFRRPAAIAADDTVDLPLFEHALDWLWEHERYRPQVVVQLRPTTPLRPRGLIDRAISLLESDPQADCVRAVTTPKQTPFKMWWPAADGYVKQLLETDLPEPYNLPRQKLPAVLWQTGHVDAIRTCTIREQHSLTGRRVRPIMVDQPYCIDIDSIEDLDAAERALASGTLNIDTVADVGGFSCGLKLPAAIDLVVFDFDGVFTDNRVLVSSDGRETVICDRADGHGISRLRRFGIPLVVISAETDPVVAARCQKLELECLQGVDDKLAALCRLVHDRGAALSNTVYVGNDINDLLCLKAVGCAVVPGDAHADVRPHAHVVLTCSGGRGAVRELCDAILKHLSKSEQDATNA
jgi:YrbI family 3-deoxy-D-manno-octulosonate 8-phosphate phosphatase